MKERITVTLDKEHVLWLDAQIERKVFANRSHALAYLIQRRMDSE